jgi:hypothetical protein
MDISDHGNANDVSFRRRGLLNRRQAESQSIDDGRSSKIDQTVPAEIL